MQYKAPKGSFDILPYRLLEEDSWQTTCKWQFLENIIEILARDYQYKEIRTPLFESTELFIRGVGESSDIISKEMYTFLDKAGRSLTLRPEGTAPVARAFIEHQLHLKGPLHRLYSVGPMFRYDRPQAGRYRQFHQLSVELIGSPLPESDAEIIDMACALYQRLGLQKLKVQINTIGDGPTRELYKQALHAYFTTHINDLSEDSRLRLEKNVLRILDSKAKEDQELIGNAPPIHSFLTPSARIHFDKVCAMLTTIGVAWERNPLLVRGLDYYCHTVFEVTSTDLGAQNALGGGGRYDGLIHTLGGPNIPSVGFACGLERILQVMQRQNIPFPSPKGPFIYFIALGESSYTESMRMVSSLRHKNIPTAIDLSSKKIGQALQKASEEQATYAIILGDLELMTQKIKLKELSTREEISLPFDQLVEQISLLYQQKKAPI